MILVRQSHKRFAILLCILVGLALFGVVAYNHYLAHSTSPTLKVGIRSVAATDESLSFTWSVTNLSEQIATFEENSIIQIRLGLHSVPYAISEQALAPGETFSLDVLLENVDTSKVGRLTVTAASNEGTTASHTVTLSGN